MPIGKLSSKGQVTIPKQVREALDLHAGDQVEYQVRGKVVTLTKVEPFDFPYHEAVAETLNEWNTAADDEAFDDL